MFRQLADALGLEMNNIEDHILGDEKVSTSYTTGTCTCVAEWLSLPTLDYKVEGLNPVGGRIHFLPYIAQSLSLSSFQHLSITKVKFEWMLNTKSSPSLQFVIKNTIRNPFFNFDKKNIPCKCWFR